VATSAPARQSPADAHWAMSSKPVASALHRSSAAPLQRVSPGRQPNWQVPRSASQRAAAEHDSTRNQPASGEHCSRRAPLQREAPGAQSRSAGDAGSREGAGAPVLASPAGGGPSPAGARGSCGLPSLAPPLNEGGGRKPPRPARSPPLPWGAAPGGPSDCSDSSPTRPPQASRPVPNTVASHILADMRATVPGRWPSRESGVHRFGTPPCARPACRSRGGFAEMHREIATGATTVRALPCCPSS
jgi:hypothetical protein